MKAASLIAAGMLVSATLHTSMPGELTAESPTSHERARVSVDVGPNPPAEAAAGAMATTLEPSQPADQSPAVAPRAQDTEPAKQDAAPTPGGDTKGSAVGGAATAAKSETAENPHSLCALMKSIAGKRELPFDFFARLIWRESRFRADVIGPRTRSGQHALGIAQFMPGTAAERGLADPFDPAQALPESADFLKELRTMFGNLGLAAAAYNAGPARVRNWLNGTAPLPIETRRYVQTITGRSADEWVAAGQADLPTTAPGPSCADLFAAMKTPPPIGALVARPGATAHTSASGARVAARPWGVQLCAGFSRDQVLSSFARMANKLQTALAGADVGLIRTRQRSRGTHEFYQVRVGAETRAEADRICARVQSAGGACLVMRNPAASIEPI